MPEPITRVTAGWCTCPGGQHPDATLTTPSAVRTGCRPAVDSPIDLAWGRLTALIAELWAASHAGYSSRELSLALTRLQEARYWLTDAPNPTPQQESK